MVLLDDNFATIVSAVEEGRVIYANTRKFIRFLMATNSSELALMLVAPLLGMPLPLLPLQILWINLVTDGLPGLALGVEPAERGIMREPPHAPSEGIFARGLGVQILAYGALMAAICTGLGYAFWRAGHPGWQTIVFHTLALTQMAHVLAIRTGRDSLLRVGVLSNKPLLGAVLMTLAAQSALLVPSPLQRSLGAVALTGTEVGVCVGAGMVVFLVDELAKWWSRRAGRSAQQDAGRGMQ